MALKEEEKPTLEPYLRELKSVDDQTIHVMGQANVNIEIGGKWFQHLCIIAETANDGLLGVDFLKKHGVVIDFSRNKVSCDGQTLLTRFKQLNNRICRVSLAETTVIPPSSRVILQGQTSKPLADGMWMIEPLSHSPGYQTILTAKVLTHACGSSIPVELMNPSENKVKLERYTNLGYASRIQEEDLLCSLDTGSSPSPENIKTKTKFYKSLSLVKPLKIT